MAADTHDGGCLCGAVRFRVSGPSVWQAGCCCADCVRACGAPLMVWAGFDPQNFALLAGQPALYRSSANVLRGFCATCGTTLTYRKDAAGDPRLAAAARVVYVATATLDDPAAYPPDEIVHGRERIAWLDLGPAVPVRERLSPTAGHLQFGGLRDGA